MVLRVAITPALVAASLLSVAAWGANPFGTGPAVNPVPGAPMGHHLASSGNPRSPASRGSLARAIIELGLPLPARSVRAPGDASTQRPAAGATLVTRSIPVGYYPGWATFDPSDGYVYVLNEGSGNVSILNGTSLFASVAAGTTPSGAVYDGRTGNVYIADSSSSMLFVFDGTTRVGSVTVGSTPGLPAFNPRNGFVYVPNQGSGTVSVVNGTKVVATVTVGAFPYNATYDPTHGFVYVMNSGAGTVSVFNGTKVIANLTVGSYPDAAIYDPHNGWEYVTNAGGNNTTILNGTKIVETVGVGWGPSYGAYDPANEEVYLANAGSDNVSILNGSQVVSSVSTSFNASGAIYDPVDGYMYVPEYGSQILLLNGSQTVSRIPVGNSPLFPAFDDANGAVYVPNFYSNNVSILQYRFGVTFSEQGLPPGDSWTVSLANGASNSSNGPRLGFGLTTGTYAYAVGASNLTYSAPSGSFRVGETSATVAILFSRVTYPVNFSETGLPLGAVWSVTVSGVTLSATVSSSSMLSFPEANGSASYRVGEVPGWTTAQFAGSVSVRGAPVSVAIVWTQTVFVAAFQESGLPAGSGWWISVTGGASTFSTTRTLSFLEPNGSYAFTVGSRNSSFRALPGNFSVSGAQQNLSVVFALVVFQLSFIEYGLPVGTPWSVQLPSAILHSRGGWANESVPNGTYAFRVLPVQGWNLSRSTGIVVVAGSSIQRALTWQRVTYGVTFSETGLPAGTQWSVTFGGETNGSAGSISFYGFPNGTYQYSVAPLSGYSAAPANGTITVNGLPVPQQVLFGPLECACGPRGAPGPGTLLGLPIWEGAAFLGGAAAVAVLAVLLLLRTRRRKSTGPGP